MSLLSICCLFAYAQQLYNQNNYFLNANSNWIWGADVYLKYQSGSFNFDVSAPVTGRMSEFSSAVASDPRTGKLLFYTDGYNIYDARHNVMPNGDSLIVKYSPYTGGMPGNGSPVILPVPGAEGSYYVFFMQHASLRASGFPVVADTNFYQLVYAKVDMSLNGGLGDVPPASKEVEVPNVILDGSMGRNKVIRDNYALMAIPGNNCDYWLVSLATNYEFTKRYFVLNRITEAGIEPAILKELDPRNKFSVPGGGYYLMPTPDRSKIFVGNPLMYVPETVPLDATAQMIGLTQEVTSEVYNFDPSSGDISNRIKIAWVNDTTNGWMFGCYSNIYNAFSPDSRFLYSIQTNFYASQVYLNQYDLSSGDSATIWNSVVTIDSFGTFQGSGKMFGCVGTEIPCLKLHDGKIYLSWGEQDYLGVINEPNKKGTACDLGLYHYSYPVSRFNSGIRVFSEVPYPMSYEAELIAEYDECQTYTLTPKFVDTLAEYVWNDGSISKQKVTDRPGKHWVTYQIFKENCVVNRVDTFVLNSYSIEEQPEITVSGRTLGTAPANYSFYQWYLNDEEIPGANSSTYTVTENGVYTVEVRNSQGCYALSNPYRVSNVSALKEVRMAGIKWYPNPVSDVLRIESVHFIRVQVLDLSGRVLLDGRGHNQSLSLKSLASGLYQVKFLTEKGEYIGTTKVVKQ